MSAHSMDASSPEQMAALAHPTRQRLLRELGGDGATVSQLSHRLRVNKGNVAHHLAVLERAGLVRRGPTRTVRGGTEQYFVKTAERIRFGPGEGGEATRAMLATIADEVPLGDDHLLNHRVVRLTPRQAEALSRHLEQVVEHLAPAGAREPEFGVLVGVYRRR